MQADSATDDLATDDLATALFATDLRGLSTSAVTARITREVVAWARACGWTTRTEARVDVPTRQAAADQLGFVDVVVRRSDRLPDLAIEIDSADKPWSVVKLQHAAAAGMHAIWIRWGDEKCAGVYDEVDVIQLSLARRPARKRTPGQLSIWG